LWRVFYTSRKNTFVVKLTEPNGRDIMKTYIYKPFGNGRDKKLGGEVKG
jgi:hypothetical protein